VDVQAALLEDKAALLDDDPKGETYFQASAARPTVLNRSLDPRPAFTGRPLRAMINKLVPAND